MVPTLFGCFVLFACCWANHVGEVPSSEAMYCALMDAGSSGTRLYFYQWDRNWAKVPRVTPVKVGQVDLSLKVPSQGRAGISTLVGKTAADVATYFKPLKDFAFEKIPAQQRGQTPLVIYATAGMRLLNETEARLVWAAVRTELNNWGFLFEPMASAKTISGQEEGIFGWNTVNLLKNTLEGDDMNTFAALDMGGASTQVTYIPEETPFDGYFENYIYSHKYPVYTHSYLKAGQDQMLINVVTSLPNSSNPCDFKGFVRTVEGKNYTGTGDPMGCKEAVRRVMGFNYYCAARPCAMWGVYMPPIPTNMNLVLFSAFAYTADNLGCFGQKTIGCLDTNLMRICTNSTMAEGRAKAPAQFVVSQEQFFDQTCFSASYFYVLLTEAYKLSPDRTVLFETQVLNHELTWAMGAVMSQAGLLKTPPCAAPHNATYMFTIANSLPSD